MQLTQKLLGWLNRVFDKDPGAVLALRLRYDGAMTWQVQDGILTTAISGGSGVALSVDLSQYTIGELAAFLTVQQGYDVPYLIGNATSTLSALTLIDGSGDQAKSNGDHIVAYTSLTWAILEAYAAELVTAEQAIAQMLLQMSVPTAAGMWLDFQGLYYDVERSTVTVGGVTGPEPDSIYGPRIVPTVLQPASNNIALEMAIESATGQEATVTDAVVYGAGSPLFDGTISFDGTHQYDSTAQRIYSLFDVQYAYDLLGADDPGSFTQRVKDIVNRLRAAGCFFRQLTLNASALSDTVPSPQPDSINAMTVSPALTDTVAAPTESETARVTMSQLSDPVGAPTETDSFGWSYSTTYDGLRLFDGSVPFASGGTITETL